MRAMILAAGFGTRMRPVTYTLPKLLVPVCNRPLIDWAVESFLRAGIRDLIVNHLMHRGRHRLHGLPHRVSRVHGLKVGFHVRARGGRLRVGLLGGAGGAESQRHGEN